LKYPKEVFAIFNPSLVFIFINSRYTTNLQGRKNYSVVCCIKYKGHYSQGLRLVQILNCVNLKAKLSCYTLWRHNGGEEV
jgi:hypothetical protein